MLKKSISELIHEPFEGSGGWFTRFLNRLGLHNIKMTGERASVDEKAANEFSNSFKDLIKDYNSDQIFSCDETKLNWKKMSSRSYLTNVKNWK